MCDGPLVLILQKIKGGFPCVILCVAQKKHADLVEQYKRCPLDPKADEKGKHGCQHNQYRRVEEIAALDSVNGFEDDVISGEARGQHEQQDRDKIGHCYDQRNRENNRCDYKSDNQRIVKCGGKLCPVDFGQLGLYMFLGHSATSLIYLAECDQALPSEPRTWTIL